MLVNPVAASSAFAEETRHPPFDNGDGYHFHPLSCPNGRQW